MNLILVREIRHVSRGYIVEARWPFGPIPAGYGPVVCKTLDEVIELLKQCDLEEEPKEKADACGD